MFDFGRRRLLLAAQCDRLTSSRDVKYMSRTVLELSHALSPWVVVYHGHIRSQCFPDASRATFGTPRTSERTEHGSHPVLLVKLSPGGLFAGGIVARWAIYNGRRDIHPQIIRPSTSSDRFRGDVQVPSALRACTFSFPCCASFGGGPIC